MLVKQQEMPHSTTLASQTMAQRIFCSMDRNTLPEKSPFCFFDALLPETTSAAPNLHTILSGEAPLIVDEIMYKLARLQIGLEDTRRATIGKDSKKPSSLIYFA
jgi:hypothetical protein